MNVSTTNTRTLRHVVRQAVLTAAATVAIAGAAFATVDWMAHEATMEWSTNPSSAGSTNQAVEPATAPSVDVERLVEQHDCWTGISAMPSDMEDQLPGHVVVTTAAEPATPTYSASLVGPALDEVFGDGDTGLTVHAFCR
jgi:hypothetical protein